MPPEKYRAALTHLKNAGVFRAVSGVLIGKPMDRQCEDVYKQLLVEVIDDRRCLSSATSTSGMPRHGVFYPLASGPV